LRSPVGHKAAISQVLSLRDTGDRKGRPYTANQKTMYGTSIYKAGQQLLSGFGMDNYFSTISRISMGQALTQMPQAMHLEAGFSGFRTMTFMGQASTHLPQETHFFLLIM